MNGSPDFDLEQEGSSWPFPTQHPPHEGLLPEWGAAVKMEEEEEEYEPHQGHMTDNDNYNQVTDADIMNFLVCGNNALKE
jgi:hypothetical protein